MKHRTFQTLRFRDEEALNLNLKPGLAAGIKTTLLATSAREGPEHPCPQDDYVHVANLLPGCDRWGWSKGTISLRLPRFPAFK